MTHDPAPGPVFDVGALYERAAEVAESALALPTDVPYILTDIINDPSSLVAALHSPSLGGALIDGTLTGCFAALTDAPHARHRLRAPLPPAPPGSAITVADMEQARDWIERGLRDPDSQVGRIEILMNDLRAYLGNELRVSSLMLAMVTITAMLTA